MDYTIPAQSIISAIAEVGEPLTCVQQIVLTEAMAVWFDQMRYTQRQIDATLCKSLAGSKWVSLKAAAECAERILAQ